MLLQYRQKDRMRDDEAMMFWGSKSSVGVEGLIYGSGDQLLSTLLLAIQTRDYTELLPGEKTFVFVTDVLKTHNITNLVLPWFRLFKSK